MPLFEKLPAHLAIIMDGNGRWAQTRNLQRSEGHKAGAEAVRRIVTECRSLGIPYLTLYAFSSENWSRPKTEINLLFNLLLKFLKNEVPLMKEKGIALNILGDINALPLPQKTALKHAMKTTAKGKDMTLNLAINYGSRTEIVQAIQRIINDKLPAESLTEQTISEYLYTHNQPDPDLLIRTSGEQRLSNYLLYQCAYSELYFTPILWPDFDKEHLHEALQAYAARSRRFGKTQEQIHGS